MEILNVGSTVDLLTVADGAWVDCAASPFIEGWPAVVSAKLSSDVAGVASVKVQGTNDGGTTIVDILYIVGPSADLLVAFTGYAQVRFSVVTAFTAGTANFDLVA